jgi:hypothetical protein
MRRTFCFHFAVCMSSSIYTFVIVKEINVFVCEYVVQKNTAGFCNCGNLCKEEILQECRRTFIDRLSTFWFLLNQQYIDW